MDAALGLHVNEDALATFDFSNVTTGGSARTSVPDDEGNAS